MDVFWGWALSTYAKPWLIQLLDRSDSEASQLFESVIEPRLWIGYVVVLAAQLAWVNLIAPRPSHQSRLRRLWWLGSGIIVLSELALWQGLELTGGPALLVLGVQLGDLILLYWLVTRLLTPLPQRQVIPGWW
jgi:hypothetical protein